MIDLLSYAATFCCGGCCAAAALIVFCLASYVARFVRESRPDEPVAPKTYEDYVNERAADRLAQIEKDVIERDEGWQR